MGIHTASQYRSDFLFLKATNHFIFPDFLVLIILSVLLQISICACLLNFFTLKEFKNVKSSSVEHRQNPRLPLFYNITYMVLIVGW